MIFPDAPHVIYKKNPLEQVICQFRFPPILKIDTQIPAEFQDAIREEFPMYLETKEYPPELPAELLAQLPPELANSVPVTPTNRMNYKFFTPDEKWNVNLTNNFLAVTCFEYDRWENFRRHIELPLKVLIDIYKPSLFSRIGLRYVNVIKRSELGLNEIGWSQLIQPHISGILSVVDQDSVRRALSNDEIKIGEKDELVRIVHGVAASNRNNEIVYLIDNDFFVESNVETTNAIEKLDCYGMNSKK